MPSPNTYLYSTLFFLAFQGGFWVVFLGNNLYIRNMKKILLAISGGVDSMCLFELFKHQPGVIVAHFDHGMRPSAKKDQEFVREQAQRAGLEFVTETASLGPEASEAAAREARYAFLKKVASERDATIYTAHHGDDLIETIMINLLRGTGWRGLVPFSDEEIKRPFLETDLLPAEAKELLSPEAGKLLPSEDQPVWKQDVWRMASVQQVVFCEDPTNHEADYFRNRIRQALADQNSEAKVANFKHELYQKYLEQRKLKMELSKITKHFQTSNGFYRKEIFTSLDSVVAMELLRLICEERNLRLTRPQLAEFLQALHKYAPGKKFNLPGDVLVTIQKNYFLLP